MELFPPPGTLVKRVIGDRIYDVVAEGIRIASESYGRFERYGSDWGDVVQVVPDRPACADCTADRYFEKYTIVD